MTNSTPQQWNRSQHKLRLAQKIASHRLDLKSAIGCQLPAYDSDREAIANLVSGALQNPVRTCRPSLENLTIEEKA